MKQKNFLYFVSVLMAAAVMVWAAGPTYAANNNPNKPILTKSGKKAAIQQAADAIIQPQAFPISPVDETAVPHYFGPFPNWANSPFTLSDVTVDITGDGAGATATAAVGANGAVTGVTITNSGSGYTAATVNFGGAGSGATADAVISPTGVVTGITVDIRGTGYTAPVVNILPDGGATTDATATVYGGVDAVTLIDPGSGYTNPTVDFDLPDYQDGVKATAHAEFDLATGAITAIVVDQPGSGYSSAPNVVIRDGTLFDPIANGGTGATGSATLELQTVVMDTFGDGYTSAPTVNFSDPTGSGASATAAVDSGAVTEISITNPGSGYLTVGMRKFMDGLPGLTDAGINNLNQYIPVAVPDTTTFSTANGFASDDDYYVIGVVQVREQMHSDLPPTLSREYVQLSTAQVPGKQVALHTDMVDGTSVPTLMPDGSQAYGVDDPHYLGPIIIAQKDKAVRVVFYNLLPTGSDGDLFMPTDSTIMGSGPGPVSDPALYDPLDEGTVMDAVRNPECSQSPKSYNCFKDSRAVLHLHGGITPWISDGTPHQWIAPANEVTPYTQGVSVGDVPDMASPAAQALGVPDCSAPDDGCQTYYWTNQQSARLMFYHDHVWGITRLDVYAGEAAGYLITDPTEQKLITDGIIPSDQIPLVLEDRTFVPGPSQLAWQDPTWDANRWGGEGNLWYHHVYMPAQNPGDPSGMSAFGRWMYGPWFWPPATPPHGPIDNPYYDPACNLDDPATWQYQTDPFCEPQLIPGTPNISVGMEQFNDTPIVNGTAYPTITVEPKPYRLRILNAANDRFFNLQLYVADPGTASTDLNGNGEIIGGTEVALNPAELAAAQLDPNIFPTPDTSVSPPGPSWIQIGTDSGFMPAPVVVPNQPITWIIDPTRFDVGNVDKHSLLLAGAERADVIVDFSAYAGQTLILYNDAPAAFPARVSTYDYYTGGPDLSPVGAPTTMPGYGPNTRTVMQIKVAAGAGTSFNLAALQAAFKHHADGSGVFESGQHPIIVGQAAYNSAYGTNFAASSYCNGGSTSTSCDGFARISDQGGDLFGFNTLLAPNAKLEIPLEPKAIHDEMNAAAFDEFGRMTANLGLEAVPATPAGQNITLYPFVNPSTEIFDATNLPKNIIMTPISPISSADGTQIWKITHNGVDTHPLHWHLYDLQLLNRVTWDNIIIPPDDTELGWKDTLRISPLEDTIVAIRPIIPQLPFDLPNSIRPLNPMMPLGSTVGFNSVDANGNPTADIVNQLVNFGWEYVFHCHILSHEEMDMMRPVSVALPPNKVDDLTATLSTSGKPVVTLDWTDNSLTETQFQVQRQEVGGPWTTLATLVQPLNLPNTTGQMTFVDSTYKQNLTYNYQILAENTVGYGGDYKEVTVRSTSNIVSSVPPPVDTPPADPTNLTATVQAGPQVLLNWTDNSINETGFVIERSVDGGATFSTLITVGPGTNTGTVSYTDTSVAAGNTYAYRVAAVNLAGMSGYTNTQSVTLPALPADPTNLTATAQAGPQVLLSWTDNSTVETGFVIERSVDGGATFSTLITIGPGINTGTVSYTDTSVVAGNTYAYRVAAVNLAGMSGYTNTQSVTLPTVPADPTNLTATAQAGPQVLLSWTDNSTNETGFVIERSVDGGATFSTLITVGPGINTGTVSYTDTAVIAGNTYVYRVAAVNLAGMSGYTNTQSVTLPAVPVVPAAPTSLTATASRVGKSPNDRVTLTWADVASETGYTLQMATDAAFTTNVVTSTLAANTTTFTTGNLPRNTPYYFRIQAFNGNGPSAWTNAAPFPVNTP